MNEEILNNYLKAGKIAVEVKKYAREIIKPGVLLIDIARKIDDKIIELGGEFGFPVNLSVDEVAAHFTPAEGETKVAGGLLKFDVGITVNGYFADTAFSIDLTKDKRHKEMIEANTLAQEEVIKVVKYGMQVKEIGEAVMWVLEKWNEEKKTKFSLIHGLSGHEVGQNTIHAGISIPNYRNDNQNILKDTAFAVEPFFTTGSGEIYSGDGGGIYSLKEGGVVRDNEARKVVKYIKENFKTRPFCKRWLERAGFTKLNYIFSTLKRQGVFYEYPLLIEKTKAPVSQVENLFVVFKGEVYVTTRE